MEVCPRVRVCVCGCHICSLMIIFSRDSSCVCVGGVEFSLRVYESEIKGGVYVFLCVLLRWLVMSSGEFILIFVAGVL